MMLSMVSCSRDGAGTGDGRWALTVARQTKNARRPALNVRMNV
jgi:hypothetical protein